MTIAEKPSGYFPDSLTRLLLGNYLDHSHYLGGGGGGGGSLCILLLTSLLLPSGLLREEEAGNLSHKEM
jgi:hypothetical protein